MKNFFFVVTLNVKSIVYQNVKINVAIYVRKKQEVVEDFIENNFLVDKIKKIKNSKIIF